MDAYNLWCFICVLSPFICMVLCIDLEPCEYIVPSPLSLTYVYITYMHTLRWKLFEEMDFVL